MFGTHRHSNRQQHDSHRDHANRRTGHGQSPSSRAQSTGSHRPSHRTAASSLEFSATRGRDLATLCVIAAFLGLSLELLNAFTAHTKGENTNIVLSILSTVLATAAAIFGACAQVIQLSTWSHRARNRILIGLPVALLTLASVIPNFWETKIVHVNTYRATSVASHASPSPIPKAAPQKHAVNSDLPLPGWYGETQQDGLLLAVSSFDPKADESQRFNRNLSTPVAYATFTVINIGHTLPVVLTSLQASLHLGSGKTVQSLALEPLLDQNVQAYRTLRSRLALPQELVLGNMLADVPICMKPDFSWSDVKGVSILFGTQKITLQGRVMTADEKKKLLSKSTQKRPLGATNSVSAEAWFKNL